MLLLLAQIKITVASIQFASDEVQLEILTYLVKVFQTRAQV